MLLHQIKFKSRHTIDYKKVKMILLDTNHTGTQEVEFIQFLIEKNSVFVLTSDRNERNFRDNNPAFLPFNPKYIYCVFSEVAKTSK